MAEELSYLGLKSAELTDLSCYAEVEAPEGGTLLLFRLGARFELAEPESVAPAGGMVIEDGWLTRPDSGGDRFMLLLRDGDDWRIAFGSVAPTPLRLVKTEELLRGKKLDGALIEQAAELAKTEVAPIDDVRASKEYRVTIVGLIVKRSLEALAK
mgnify:CR=1 FL=1